MNGMPSRIVDGKTAKLSGLILLLAGLGYVAGCSTGAKNRLEAQDLLRRCCRNNLEARTYQVDFKIAWIEDSGRTVRGSGSVWRIAPDTYCYSYRLEAGMLPEQVLLVRKGKTIRIYHDMVGGWVTGEEYGRPELVEAVANPDALLKTILESLGRASLGSVSEGKAGNRAVKVIPVRFPSQALDPLRFSAGQVKGDVHARFQVDPSDHVRSLSLWLGEARPDRAGTEACSMVLEWTTFDRPTPRSVRYRDPNDREIKVVRLPDR